MKCISCAALNLQQYPKHANLGMGKCKSDPMSGVFYPINRERECERFEKASQDAINKREAWWQGKIN